jgi:GAF domain-containing protein
MEQQVSVREDGSKEDTYRELLPQIRALVESETDLVANLANISAALKTTFKHYSWVGFHLLKGGELVLGPFQGKLACTRIQLGRGVCGTSADQRKTLVVDDVRQFSGHITCDPDSRSEIVVPIADENALFGVLDVDSNDTGSFDEVDKLYLEELSKIISSLFTKTRRSQES